MRLTKFTKVLLLKLVIILGGCTVFSVLLLSSPFMSPASAAPSTPWTYCGPEGSYCTFTGTKIVEYGWTDFTGQKSYLTKKVTSKTYTLADGSTAQGVYCGESEFAHVDHGFIGNSCLYRDLDPALDAAWSASVGDGNKSVTVSFSVTETQLGTLADLKSKIMIKRTGEADFKPLDPDDSVSNTTSGGVSTLQINFKNPLMGFDNQIRINAGALADLFGEPFNGPIEINNLDENDLGSWQYVGDRGLSVGKSFTMSLAIVDGTPYIAYIDDGRGNELMVKKYDGNTNSWVLAGNGVLSTGAVSSVSTSVSGGVLYVAYDDAANGSKASVMKYDGTSWMSVGSGNISAGVSAGISLSVANGIPYIAYIDGANSYKITVKKYDESSGGWVTLDKEGFSQVAVSQISLSVYNGTPYVAYRNEGSERILYNGNYVTLPAYTGVAKKFDPTSGWTDLGQFSDGGDQNTSLIVDGGIPYVAYVDLNGDAITLKKYDGSSWTKVDNGSLKLTADGNPAYTSFYFSGDTLYVAYQGSGATAVVKKLTGSSWITVGVSGITEGTAIGNSLYVDNGVPYLANSVFIFGGAIDRKPGIQKFTLTPPALTADTSSDDIANPIDITFPDLADWRNDITEVKDGTTTISAAVYTISAGKITLDPGVLATGTHTITVSAGRYADATVNQTVLQAYTVTYDGNGAISGSVPTDRGTYEQGVTVSVYGNTGNLAKTGYTFAGWNTAADGSGVTTYAAGDTFPMGTANVKLYAKWTMINAPAPVAPTITTEPSSRIVTAGQTATFTVAASGDMPLSYQWEKDGVNMNGEVAATLSIANAQASDAGSYSVVVANAAGRVTSGPAILTVNAVVYSAPSAPSGLTAKAGDGQVTLTWTGVQGAVTYSVYQRIASGSYSSTSATVSAATYVYTAAGLTNGATYYFAVKANNEGGSSGYSSEVSATPSAKAVTASSNVPIQVTTEPISITVPADVTTATIAVATTTSGSDKEATLPFVDVHAATSLGNVSVTIQDGTKITAPAAWDGTIKLPQVLNSSSVTVGNGSVSAVVEVGSTDVSLTFDKAVRLFFPGQGNKRVGFVRNGVFTEISNSLSEDSQEAASGIIAGGDAKIAVDNDLVVWTKHFTKFVTYTPVAATSPDTTETSGDDEDGSAVANSATIAASSGGTVMMNGATIAIPAGAMASDVQVTVDKVSDTSILPVDSALRLVSDVYAIRKDKDGDFINPVVITLPFDKSKIDFAKSTAGVYWLNEQLRKWVPLDSLKVDEADGTASGTVTHFAKFAVLASDKAKTLQPQTYEADFADMKGHWSEASVLELVKLGAINGYPDNTFKPDANITRAEFVTVIVKAFHLQAQTGKTFADTENHWAKNVIATAAAAGLVAGYSDNRFGPDDPITREQMAAIVVRAVKLAAADKSANFPDSADISDWARTDLATATAKGLIDGYEDGTMKPKANTTRAEAVTVILRALQLKA